MGFFELACFDYIFFYSLKEDLFIESTALMRIVYILLALFFSVGRASGMEEDATGEALQKARHIVRQVVERNVKNFINKRIQSIDERVHRLPITLENVTD